MANRVRLNDGDIPEPNGGRPERETNPDYPLTEQQKLFCRELVQDENQTQAAIRAGYSERSAAQQGSRLVTYANIQKYLAELREERNSRLDLTGDDVLSRIAMIILADIRDVCKWQGRTITMKPSSEISDDTAYAINSVKETMSKSGDRSISIKLENKLTALAHYGKALGLFDKTINKEDADEFVRKIRDLAGEAPNALELLERADEEENGRTDSGDPGMDSDANGT